MLVCQSAKPVRGARAVAIVPRRASVMCRAGRLGAASLLTSAHTCVAGASRSVGLPLRIAGNSSAERSAMMLNVTDARDRA